MTKRRKIADGYKGRHTRTKHIPAEAGSGYPDIRMTFYEFNKIKVSNFVYDQLEIKPDRSIEDYLVMDTDQIMFILDKIKEVLKWI